jgi:outer membrane protein
VEEDLAMSREKGESRVARKALALAAALLAVSAAASAWAQNGAQNGAPNAGQGAVPPPSSLSTQVQSQPVAYGPTLPRPKGADAPLPPPLLGKGALPKTLTQALVAAYSTNPTLLSERAHLRSVDENVPQALAGWRPQIVAQGEAGYGYGTQSFYLPPGPATSFDNARDIGLAQATLTQPLFTGGKVHGQVTEAENNVLAERAKLIATEEQVFQQAISAYVTVIQDQQLLALQINNEQVLTRQLQATNDRFRVGEITRTDVAQAEAALAAARSARETATR